MRSSKALVVLPCLGLFLAGCADSEAKLGRGISNVLEPVRLGELQRSYEQTYLYDGPDAAATRGVVQGINRTIGRTFVGAFEVVTFPIPSDPYFKPVKPVYPDSYTPRATSSSAITPDANLGFDGQDICPIIPGSRFTIFGD
jgi:putative exosortase-associated protein (TIGR04073 family)